MKILKNYTRYNTEDLQAVLDFVVSLPDLYPKRYGWVLHPSWRLRDRGADYEMDVDYWSGDVMGDRGSWQNKIPGPWYVPDPQGKAKKLLILHPNEVLETLSPAEALATTSSVASLPEAAIHQMITLVSAWAHVESIGRLSGLPVSLGVLRVRIEKNQADRKKPLPVEAQIKRLRDIFQRGAEARKLGDSRYEISLALRRYAEASKKTEEQRARLLKKGGQAEPHATTVELLERLLAEAKQAAKRS